MDIVCLCSRVLEVVVQVSERRENQNHLTAEGLDCQSLSSCLGDTHVTNPQPAR